MEEKKSQIIMAHSHSYHFPVFIFGKVSSNIPGKYIYFRTTQGSNKEDPEFFLSKPNSSANTMRPHPSLTLNTGES